MKKYNLATALKIAQLSEAVYPSEIPLSEKAKTIGYELVKEFGDPENGQSGCICKCADHAVIIFKGTNNKETLISDLKFWHTTSEHVDYAAGFFEAYEQLIIHCSDFLKSNTLPLYLGGHSLGGAIATIAALKMETIAACYTFGAPRVGGVSVENLDDDNSIFRFINSSDPVPSLPLIIMGYWPLVGRLCYISGNKIITGWQAYTRRVFGQILPVATKSIFGVIGSAEHHFIDRYISAIKSIREA